jgi:hypothetical protein
MEPVTYALIGAGAFVLAALLNWSALPTGGQEKAIVNLPGMWIVLPLAILLGYLGGGALVFSNIVK